MAEIRAFRGVRYNLEKVGDGGRLVSPPYDVIDAKLQQELYDANPSNIVRVIQGKVDPADGGENAVYVRARDSYRDWLEEGVLEADDTPSIYVYTQTFDIHTPEGVKRKSRQGIVALVEIQRLGEGGIYPHEHTMPGPKKGVYCWRTTTTPHPLEEAGYCGMSTAGLLSLCPSLKNPQRMIEG